MASGSAHRRVTLTRPLRCARVLAEFTDEKGKTHPERHQDRDSAQVCPTPVPPWQLHFKDESQQRVVVREIALTTAGHGVFRSKQKRCTSRRTGKWRSSTSSGAPWLLFRFRSHSPRDHPRSAAAASTLPRQYSLINSSLSIPGSSTARPSLARTGTTMATSGSPSPRRAPPQQRNGRTRLPNPTKRRRRELRRRRRPRQIRHRCSLC